MPRSAVPRVGDTLLRCIILCGCESGVGQNEPCHSFRLHGRSTSISGPAGPAVGLPGRATFGLMQCSNPVACRRSHVSIIAIRFPEPARRLKMRRRAFIVGLGSAAVLSMGQRSTQAAIVRPDFTNLPPYGNSTLPPGIRSRILNFNRSRAIVSQ